MPPDGSFGTYRPPETNNGPEDYVGPIVEMPAIMRAPSAEDRANVAKSVRKAAEARAERQRAQDEKDAVAIAKIEASIGKTVEPAVAAKTVAEELPTIAAADLQPVLSLAARARMGFRSLWDRARNALTAPASEKKPVVATSMTERPRGVGMLASNTPEQRKIDVSVNATELQDNAIERYQANIDRDSERVRVVTEILSRKRPEPLPRDVGARYAAEVQALRARLQKTQQLLRVAEGTRDRNDYRKAA